MLVVHDDDDDDDEDLYKCKKYPSLLTILFLTRTLSILIYVGLVVFV